MDLINLNFRFADEDYDDDDGLDDEFPLYTNNS